MVTCGMIVYSAAFKRLSHLLRNFVDGGDQNLVIGAIVDENGELVAADPARCVRHYFAEPPRDFLNEAIANDMTHGVVDDLQIVDIDNQQAECRLVGNDPVAHHIVKAAPVRKTGELIVIG